jgi:steroid 5-alpha reductase family enzyme
MEKEWAQQFNLAFADGTHKYIMESATEAYTLVHKTAMSQNTTVLTEYITNPSADPMTLNFLLLLVSVVGVWVLSIITSNVSQVDRLWSIIPACSALIFAKDEIPIVYRNLTSNSTPEPVSYRIILQAGLVVLWGFRLTFNFARKGGFAMSYEDHRWEEAKLMFGPIGFQVWDFILLRIQPVQLRMLLNMRAVWIRKGWK